MTPAHVVNSLHTEVARIKAHLFGFVNVYILNTGLELGLFDELRHGRQGGMTVTELARRKGLHEPYLLVWCRCAYGCRYLDVTADGCFRLAPHMDAILADPHHPAYMGNILQLFAIYCTDDLLEHPEYLQTGEVFPYMAHGERFFSLLNRQGVVKGANFLELVIPSVPGLSAKLNNGAALLDLGCGGGSFLLTVARAYPRCTFLGIDVDPHALQAADIDILRAGLSTRVRVERVDARTMNYARTFDVITMNSTLRELPLSLQPQIISSCFKALKPEGVLIITDFALPDCLYDLRDPVHRPVLLDLIVELNWGRCHRTRQEQIALFTRAGFVDVCHEPLGDNMYTLLWGKRPCC